MTKALQSWYNDQLGGVTFAIKNDDVEVIQSTHKNEWFITANPSSGDEWGWQTWSNILGDIGARLGGRSENENWAVYSSVFDLKCERNAG